MSIPRQNNELRNNNGGDEGGGNLSDVVRDEFVERRRAQPLVEQQMLNHQEQQPQQRLVLSPSELDSLLSQEMMQLSLRTRNDIQEEIHGVKCLAPTETPELVVSSIRQMEAEFDLLQPSEKNNAFLVARRLSDESYANTLEFKLRFLRKSLFDAKEASISIVEYCYRMQTIFGDFALRRNINLHKDFSRAELREFRKGRYQLLPFRDRSGRRMIVIFPDEEFEQIDVELRAKFITYLMPVLAKDDEETQQKGVVIIVWFAPSYNISYRPPAYDSVSNNYGLWGCVRIAAFHICSPDTPEFRFRRAITVVRAYRFRSRLKMHLGTQDELRYMLHGYGIPTENIPITSSGTIKTIYFKTWMKLRKAIEDDDDLQRRNRLQVSMVTVPRNSLMSGVVECPNTNDVVFRQGTAMNCHPGNARFRSLVEEIVIKLRETSNVNPNSQIMEISEKGNDATDILDFYEEGSSIPSVTTSTLIFDLIDRIIKKDKGRVLMWTQIHGNEKFGCWRTITNEDQIYSKIEYIVRENIRGGYSQFEGPTTIEIAATSAETEANSTPIPDTIVSKETEANSTPIPDTIVSKDEKQKSNIQNNDSSTSIFQNQSLSSAYAPPPVAPSLSSPKKRAKTSGTEDEAKKS